MSDELFKRLDALAAKLGTTAQYLWGVLVRQARVEWITDSIVCAVCLVLCATCIAFSVKSWRKGQVNIIKDERNDGMFALSVLLAVVSVVFLIAFLVNVVDIPTALLNPEFYALQQVVKGLK